MRNKFFTLFIFAIALWMSSCQPKNELLYLGKDGFYYSPQFAFKAWFPHRPDIQSSEITVKDTLKVPFTSFMYNDDTWGVGLSVAEYPANFVSDTLAVLKAAESGMFKAMQVTKLAEDIKLKPVPAITFSATGAEHGLVGLVLYYDNKLYQLMVVDVNDVPDTSLVNKFIGNFAIVENLKNKKND